MALYTDSLLVNDMLNDLDTFLMFLTSNEAFSSILLKSNCLDLFSIFFFFLLSKSFK